MEDQKPKKVDGRKNNSRPRLPEGEKKGQISIHLQKKMINALGYQMCKRVCVEAISEKYYNMNKP